MIQSKIQSGSKRPHGFTLLELIVVITIIGILASFVVVRTAGFGYNARKVKAVADMQSIANVADGMKMEVGRYPEAVEDMINAVDDNGAPLSSVLDKFPKDPWGNEYIYEIVEGRPTLQCFGADGQEGGEGEDVDLFHPDNQEEL